jgi:tetratricopeptide (TPR) repeat protein
MPLQKFLAGQKQAIAGFLAEERPRLLRIGVDPEEEALVIKLLAAIDGDPDNDDVFIGFDQVMEAPEPFYQQALAQIAEECRKVGPQLEEKGIRLAIPDALPAGPEPVEQRFAAVVAKLAAGFPAAAGRLVLALGPGRGPEDRAYPASLGRLLDALAGSRVKLITLDLRATPQLAPLARRPDVRELDFHISPEIIEQGIKNKLAEPSCPPLWRMRHLASLAGFAMARKDFATALRLGQEVQEHFRKEGNAQEEAVAAFNLGNTHYRKGDYTPARASYERALDLAIAQQMHNLTEQCLLNIGNTWFQVGQFGHALAHYEGAARWSRAISNPFGLAQAFDLIGLVHQKQGRPAEARRAWEEALGIYRGMGPEMSQMAQAGENQIQQRLATLPDRAGARPQR